MEKLVAVRLDAFLERRGVLRKYQFGFRKNLSASDQLLRFTEYVKSEFASGRMVGAVFMDISKAYDRVWRHGLMLKLCEIGLRGRLLWWICDLLKDRHCQVRVWGTLSKRHLFKDGLPQGGVLSTRLWNIFYNDVLDGRQQNH